MLLPQVAWVDTSLNKFFNFGHKLWFILLIGYTKPIRRGLENTHSGSAIVDNLI
ncbi:MAG: hypothetical protein IIX32_04240 [Alistipes sp.]|nr:hypothetical protein [Alistipes sp.]